MRKETKDALYSMLDLMDSLGTIDFLKIDIEKVNRTRKEVLDVISEKNSPNVLDSSYADLLGTLPLILLDAKKFPSTKEILEFAEKCLNITIKQYWYKRSKPEVVGIIINEVYNQSPQQFNKFLQAWNDFNNPSKELRSNENSDTFIETWFNFFDSYKGKNNDRI